MRRILAAIAVLAFCSPAFAGACQHRVFESSPFTICGFDTHDMTMMLAVADREGRPYRSFAAFAAHHDAQRIRFAMNAGMFGTDGLPIGLYVENGAIRHKANTRRGGGNFHMQPNGVFAQSQDGSLTLEPTAAFVQAQRRVRWATQSGPMLVIAGRLQSEISENGPSRNIRNGVGLLDAHRAWFVISDAPVSFGRLARFFRDGLHCREALYFDGAVSSLWQPDAGRQDAHAALGPLVVVSNRR